MRKPAAWTVTTLEWTTLIVAHAPLDAARRVRRRRLEAQRKRGIERELDPAQQAAVAGYVGAQVGHPCTDAVGLEAAAHPRERLAVVRELQVAVARVGGDQHAHAGLRGPVGRGDDAAPARVRPPASW